MAMDIYLSIDSILRQNCFKLNERFRAGSIHFAMLNLVESRAWKYVTSTSHPITLVFLVRYDFNSGIGIIWFNDTLFYHIKDTIIQIFLFYEFPFNLQLLQIFRIC